MCIKDIALEDKECQRNEFMKFMFRMFNKFLKHEKEISRLHKQSEESSLSISTCHQCGEKEHIRPNLPQN